jgi:hypothetical protein
MRHVFGSFVCRWFTCLIMLMVLVYVNACEFVCYILFHALEVEFMCFKFKFSFISTRVVIYHQKGGDCNHLGHFAPLVRVCFSDK